MILKKIEQKGRPISALRYEITGQQEKQNSASKPPRARRVRASNTWKKQMIAEGNRLTAIRSQRLPTIWESYQMKMSSAILGALFALFVLAGTGLSSAAHAGDDFINTDAGCTYSGGYCGP